MNNEEQKGFLEIAFAGLSETVANRINQRLQDIAPRAVDWLIEKLLKYGAEKYKEIKTNYEKSKHAPVLYASNNRSNNVANLDCAIENYKSNACDKKPQFELLETVADEISNDYEMWKELSIFIQEIKCPHCGECILDNWYDCITVESSNERNMGTEVIYSIECDDYHCPRCQRIFAVEGYICTYPGGIYDSHDLKVSTS